jgi:TrmH family RNA methyltransferase
VITSPHNSKIKLVRALLGRARDRREEAAFVAEGVRLIEEAQTGNWKFRFALYDDSLGERGKAQVERLKSGGVHVEMVSDSLMKSLSETESPQGILAVLEFMPLPLPVSPDFLLIADQIRDPGNLGTLLRTAAATGVQALLIPSETTDAFAPKVVRAGMGAHFRLPIHTTTWEEIGEYAKHIRVYLADMHGPSCWDTDLRQPLALVVGGEAEGASAEAHRLATQKVSVPMTGSVESLNAGVAGSVLMFEVVRQRTVSSDRS